MNPLELRAAMETMLAYLMLKVKQRDWHGVADAAMDLREMEKELKLTEEQRGD